MPKVLVACEESQAVTIELRKLGIEAYSCDIQDESGGYPDWHIKGDVLSIMNDGSWDMLIAFPPCTHLASSGAAHFKKKIADGRQQEGIDFFMEFVNCKIPLKAIENPVGVMSTKYRKPDQIIQPWQYGHEASKATCLWLIGLPLLQPTAVVGKGQFIETIRKTGKKAGQIRREGIFTYKPDGTDRAKAKSKTFPGIAAAMADQWGRLLIGDTK